MRLVQSNTAPKWSHWILFLIVAGLSLLIVYGSSYNYFFYWDDFNLLEFTSQHSFGEFIRLSFIKPEINNGFGIGTVFRPIPHYLYFNTIQSLFGLNPIPFRLVNLGLYWLSGLLVAILGQLMTRQWPVGFLAGVLFVINRIFFEAIFWICQNQEIAMVFFALLAVVGYLRYLEKKGWGNYALSLLGLGAGLLCKETTIIVPGLMVLANMLKIDERPFRKRIQDCLILWPHVLLIIVMVAARFSLILYALEGGGESQYRINPNPLTLVTNQLWGLWWNVETFVEPWRMGLNSLTKTFSLFQPIPVSALVLIGTFGIGLWLTKTKGQRIRSLPIWFGLGWFVLASLPPLVNGVLSSYLFALASVGFVITLAYGLLAIIQMLNPRRIISGAILASIVILSVISAKLISNNLERTSWPAVLIPYVQRTVELAQTAHVQQPEHHQICLVNFPGFAWNQVRADAAMKLLVAPQASVTILADSNQQDLCPVDSIVLAFSEETLLINVQIK